MTICRSPGRLTIMSGRCRPSSLSTLVCSIEIAAVGHARQFNQPAERDLAPLPARLRAAQGADELVGLRVQRALDFGERAELLAEHAVRFDARFFDVGQPRLILIQNLLHRLEQPFDLRFALLERAGGFGGERGEFLLGEMQECFVVFRQRVGGETCECFAQFNFAFLGGFEFRFERSLGFSCFTCERAMLLTNYFFLLKLRREIVFGVEQRRRGRFCPENVRESRR